MKFKLLPLIICIAIPLCIGAIGGFATASEIGSWYSTLRKPSFNPPSWLFGPVWSTLYVLMGIASYLVWQKREEAPSYSLAAGIYITQLLFNLGWTFIFFKLHEPGIAFAEIISLLVLTIINAALFYRISKWAGLLFVPYILWVSFATILNYSIWALNSGSS